MAKEVFLYTYNDCFKVSEFNSFIITKFISRITSVAVIET